MTKVTIPACLSDLSKGETWQIEGLLRRFGNARRIAYNQIHKKRKSKSEIVKELQGVTGLNSCYSADAYNSVKDLPDKVTFGGKKNQELREKRRITKEEFHRKRNCVLISRGNQQKKGNLNLRVIERDELKLRINVGFKRWICPDLFIPDKYLKKYGHLLNGSKAYQVVIARKDGYSKDYVVRITVSPEVDLEEKSRVMALDVNSGHIDWSVVNKKDKSLVETGRINCYELLDASSNKTENLLYRIVDKIGSIAEHYNAEVVGGKLNTGEFSGFSKVNRKIKSMPQYKLRKILGYKLPLRGTPYKERSEAYTSVVGQYLAKPLGLDVHKASAYSFGIKLLDYEGFKNLHGFLSDYGDGIHREGKTGGCELTALVQLLAKGYDSVWTTMKDLEATPNLGKGGFQNLKTGSCGGMI